MIIGANLAEPKQMAVVHHHDSTLSRPSSDYEIDQLVCVGGKLLNGSKLNPPEGLWGHIILIHYV